MFVLFRRTISFFVLLFISLGIFGIFEPAFLYLSKLQFGQFFLDMSVKTAVLCFSILIVSFIFGRIYCSTLCPLGAFQDIAGALCKPLTGKKYTFRPQYKFRYLILIITAVLFILGVPALIGIFDPYSIYVRGASRLLDQAIGAVMDIVTPVLKNYNIYSYYSPGNIGFLLVLPLVLIFFAAFFRGRLFCNTLCPVGIILGCVSQAQIIRPTFKENCISCGKCEAVCKSECIRVTDRLIDSSRCVMCGNCVAACPVAAMDYLKRDIKYDHEKRASIKSMVSIAFFIALPMIKAKKFLMNTPALSALSEKIAGSGQYPQIPAGAMSWARLLDKCIGCHACIKRCPSKVLEAAGVKFGLNGVLKPMLNFDKGFCQYDCIECGQACPFGAIMPIGVGEKHKIQAGIAFYDQKLCVIITKGERCGACAEHCPTGALEMKLGEEGIIVPVIEQEFCVGCGACEYMCPIIPEKAIVIKPLAVHQTAEMLEFRDDANIIEEKNDGFVF